MPEELIPWITDALVEVLGADAPLSAWATGGIHVRRAPPMEEGNAVRRRDRYIVISDVVDSTPEHTQGGPATLTTDRIIITAWASSSRQAGHGAHLLRRALDGHGWDAAGILVQRIFWQGTTTREAEDASGAEQLMDAAIAEFDVAYTLPD